MPSHVLELADGLTLTVETLPGQEVRHGVSSLIVGASPTDGLALEELQLLEETEYSYSLTGQAIALTLEPRELFSASDATGLSGRLRTGRATGCVEVVARDSRTHELGRTGFEVRSRKLNYLSEYRWMLERIASEAAEAVQSHFAPSSFAAFKPSAEGLAQTLYQRFAFVRSVVRSTEFDAALQEIVRRPHAVFEDQARTIDPSRGLRASSSVLRDLIRPGPRLRTARNLPAALASLPSEIRTVEKVQSVDTVPNRFIRHALEAWRALAVEVAAACQNRSDVAARRGVIEARELAEHLDGLLRSAFFNDVGRLGALPSQNTVLLGRSGYRDVFRAYVQAEAAALVDWNGGDDIFGAGQRDVAALYEYWTFLELARVIESLPNFQLDRRPLFKQNADGLSLELKRGRASMLRGVGERYGRAVEIELWFNRAFKRGSESWTEPMRPDCSLRITTTSDSRSAPAKWLHFDAKYRVDNLSDLFQRDEPSGAQKPNAEATLRPMSADLLKMHAYRDALKRTSGAYVLYPGGDEPATRHSEFHELLPGLGAFVLRPTESGSASPRAVGSLTTFIEDAIEHTAATGTDEERAIFWRDRVYAERRGSRLQEPGLSDSPPAEITVLLGFTHGALHRDWISHHGEYNLRADERRGAVRLNSPELSAEYLVLYGDDTDDVRMFRSSRSFVVRTGEELAELAYPSPTGTLYCCLQLDHEIPLPDGFTRSSVRMVLEKTADIHGAPQLTDLQQLLATTTDIL